LVGGACSVSAVKRKPLDERRRRNTGKMSRVTKLLDDDLRKRFSPMTVSSDASDK
jgi:hypothetical protein